MRLKKSLFFLLFAQLPLVAAPVMKPGVDFSIAENGDQDIAINNRILLKVNGSPISVLDVVKKMDLHFYRQYPNLASSPLARYQFYLNSWRTVLQTVIDDQLILADADEKKVEVTDGDVREELEELFGPDVVLNIDKIGLTYEEAWDLLKKELKVRRMTGMMVRARAMNEVNPKAIREQYEVYLKGHPSDQLWVYRVFSIKGTDESKVMAVAEEAQHLLAASSSSFEEIVSTLQRQEEDIQITLSEEYERKGKELSDSHKAVLSALTAGGISLPVLQVGKNNKEMTARLFYLKNHRELGAAAFSEMKDKLQSELLQKAVMRHTQAYLDKLRNYYGITETYVSQMIPKNFEPFALR